jgi:hypothetical protein
MKYKGVDMQIKPAVLVKQHFKIIFRFQIFNCLVVSRLNHAFHNIDPPKRRNKLLNQKHHRWLQNCIKCLTLLKKWVLGQK